MVKKVAFCEAGFDIFYGAQQSLYTFLANVDKEKIDPVVLCPGNGEFTDQVSKIGLEVSVVKQPDIFDQKGNVLNKKGLSNKFNTVIGFLKHVKKYMSYYKEEKIDLVYCNDIRSILTSGLAARLRRLPVIWYVRIDKDLGIFNWIAANIATQVVTIADSLQTMFPKRFIYNSSKKFSTIYTGINLEEVDSIVPVNLRDELKLSDDTRLVALIGSIQPRKGQKDFIEAIKNINTEMENTKFLIVGDLLNETHKDYLNEIKETIRKNNLEDDVIFLGKREDVISIMKQIDLVVLPSYSEGLPRTILESFSCSCPVIATNVAGASEIITNRKNGILIKPGDINELAESMLYLVKDKKRLSIMGLEGRKCIENKFTLTGYIKSLENLIVTEAK